MQVYEKKRHSGKMVQWKSLQKSETCPLLNVPLPPSPHGMLAIRRFGYKSLDETGSPVHCFSCCSLKHSHHDPPSDVLQLPLLRCMLAPGIPRPCCGPAAYAMGSSTNKNHHFSSRTNAKSPHVPCINLAFEQKVIKIYPCIHAS